MIKNLVRNLLVLMVILALLPVYSVYATVVSTFAGTGSHGSHDGENAQFNLPHGIFAGQDGRLFVADTHNNLIRTIDGYGVTERVSGDVLTRDDNRFPAGYHRDGRNALFNRPTGGLAAGDGRLFIADAANHAIRVIDGDTVYTFAGGRQGHINGSRGSARFNWPSAIAADKQGNLFIADTLNHSIRRIDYQTGRVTTLAGARGRYGYADGHAVQALFNSPMGIAVSDDGSTVYIADTGNHVIRVIENRQVRTLAGTLILDDEEVPAGGFADGYAARFNLPQGLFLWNEGLIVADSANHRIRLVTHGGKASTLSGTGEPGYVNGVEAQFHFPRDVYIVNGTLFIADTGNNAVRYIRKGR